MLKRILSLLAILALVGCTNSDSPTDNIADTAERAGQGVEEAVEDTGDNLNDAGDEMGDKMEEISE